jgi:hypothetical protein
MPEENGMVLETDERARLVADLLTRLAVTIPGSVALLRGSLAEGRADPYSDIDLLWDVPDADFSAAIASLPVTLSHIRPVASLRFDPDFQHSTRRRLAFIRYAGVPLFWRVDLDIFARSVTMTAITRLPTAQAGRSPRAAWQTPSRPSKPCTVAGTLRRLSCWRGPRCGLESRHRWPTRKVASAFWLMPLPRRTRRWPPLPSKFVTF